MARRRRLFEMRPGEPNEGIRMSSSALSDEEILCRVGETVEAKLRGGDLTPIAMRPSRGFLSLGMRDVRASPPPIPKDARRRAINRAHVEAQKKRKDAKAAKRMKKILAHEKLDKRRRQQRKDGLPLEESPSPSLSTEASDGDYEGEMGRGPVDHLPDIGETVPGALASSPVLPGGGGGGGGGDLGSAIARSGAEADTPVVRVLGKRAVSPVGSAAAVEQVAVEATQLPPQGTEGASGSVEDQPVPMDTEAMPLPPPLPLQTRVAVPKRLPPCSSSTTHWVAEVQAALHRGAASARADPKEPATQGGAAEAALTQEGEAAPPPRDGEARGSDASEVALAVETIGTEVPGAPQAGATEAAAPKAIEATTAGTGAPGTTEAMMAEAGAPGTTEAMMAEAGAPGTTEADVIMAGLPA
ncbi:uncharacterized protein [Miscanthus floridulus]|uniref:uncharacterized protein n=1 Tax=Miscanthus floridulus TaxID=154761 RepID=UPI00345A3E76